MDKHDPWLEILRRLEEAVVAWKGKESGDGLA